MKKAIVITLAFSMLALGLQACGDERPGPNIRGLTGQEAALVNASNAFGFELFRKVVDQTEGNVFISPLSVSLALGMTYNGARGSTEEGMRETLGFGELSTEEINQGYQGLIDYLINLDPDVQMEIANSIWYRDGFAVLQEFIDINVTYFDALVSALDFSDAGAADVINAWVAEKTHGLIEDIVEGPIRVSVVMYLINAIYFKGTWTYQFEESNTTDGTFHAASGQEQPVKLMQQHGDMAYLENQDFQAVNLPYGHELFSMTVILPAPEKDIDELIAEMNDANWASMLSGFEVHEVDLKLPRFELEFEKSLKDVLIAMGMQDAFDSGVCDLSGINGAGGLFISEVKHKTFVRVNEEGTEAAAVTSVEVELSSVTGYVMVVDRPFLVIIHDANSKSMLFMGKIVELPAE